MARVDVMLKNAEVQGLGVGSVVVIEVRGRITSLSEGEEDEAHLSVEGESRMRPASFDEAAQAAYRQLSNAPRPVDFPMGQRELHSP